MNIGLLELKHRIRQWQTKADKRKRWQIHIAAWTVITAGVIVGAASIRWSGDQPVVPKQQLLSETKVEDSVRSASVAAQLRTHKVAVGETISTIAAQYDLDIETVQNANPGLGTIIHPGDEVVILPQKGALHVVDAGDTLWRLSTIYGVAMESIITANSKANEKIIIGEKLFIPGGKLSRAAATPVSRGVTARFLWPTSGEFSSPFGYRWGRLHAGIDIANDIGTPIRAAHAGQVLSTGWDGGYGYTIVIDHGQDYTSLYGHLDSYAVTPGQYVQTGQFIGRMGNTGNSTGPHLHFEVRVNNKPVNPMSYLN